MAVKCVLLCLVISISSGALISPVSGAVSVAGPAAEFPGCLIDVPPTLDGRLDDPCWQNSPSTTDFHFSPKNQPSSETTIAWLCYDRRNIYVAFDCRDSQPEKIRAQQRKRGSEMYQDDWVELRLDLLHDHNTETVFTVNPLGTQHETLPGSGIKIEWAGDWQAATQKTAAGWAAEMAIPWAILRYNHQAKVMGVAFVRRNARLDEEWTAPDVGEAADKTRWFNWGNLELPPMRPKPMILGYSFLAGGNGSGTLHNGFDLKQPLTSSLTGLLTINPDFATVEQDVESVDFTYTPRILTDRRAFFQEGTDLMPDDYNQFYSRNIMQVDGGVKVAGTFDDYRLMALNAREPDGVNHLYGRIVKQLGALSSIGFGVASRSGLDGVPDTVTGYLSGRSGRTTSKREESLEASLYQSQTEGTGGDGRIMRIAWDSYGAYRTPSYYLKYSDYQPDYNAGDGLIPEPDQKGWSAGVSYQDRWDKGRWQGWWAALDTNFLDRQDGSLLTKNADLKLNLWERRGIGYGANYHAEKRAFPDPENPSHYVINNDRTMGIGGNWGWRDLVKNGSAWISWGNVAGGKYRYGRISQGMKLSERQVLNLSFERIKISGGLLPMNETRAVVTATHDLTSERSIGGRVILGPGWSNVFLTYRQSVRRGMDVYLIFGNPDPYARKTEMRVTAKLVYPIGWFW